ncbi:MAG TPA: hypothetical protein VMM57_10475 [Bacteroidota bacterium]|nr:hypothetical protein [Bacteroidota bacterium]
MQNSEKSPTGVPREDRVSPQPSTTLFSSPSQRFLLALMLIPFLMRFVLVWQKFSVLVKHAPLLEDDFYYYLNIARNVCAGNGFTADGHTPTTGFQFIQEILCIVITWLCHAGSEAPFRIVLTLQVLTSLACLFVLMGNMKLIFGPAEARIAGFLFAWWLLIFRHGNNGLETILQILMLLLLIRLSYRCLISRSNFSLLMLSLTCGLSIFVRIDLLAFPVSLVVVAALMYIRRMIPARHAAAAIGAVSSATALALALLFFFNVSVNAHLLPDSGAAVKELSTEYVHSFFSGNSSMAGPRRALSVLLADLPYNQFFEAVRLPVHPAIELTAIAVVLAVASLCRRRQSFSGTFFVFATLFGVYAVVLVSFYTFYVPAVWYFSRYLFTVAVFSFIVFVPPVSEALAFVRGRIPKRYFLSLAVAFSLWYAAPAAERWSHFMVDPTDQISDEDLKGKPISETRISHIYDIGRWVKFNIPSGTRVAMWQNGLAEYVSGADILHVDGIVNRPALEAWTENRLDRYLRDNGVKYLIDFQSFTAVALRHSESPQTSYEFVGMSSGITPGWTAVAMYKVNR